MSRLHRFVMCAAAILAGIVHGTSALSQAALPGSRIRIVPLDGETRKEGTLVAMTDDSLSYRPGLSDAMLTMPMDSVRTVFVSDGLHSRTGHTLRFGLIGAGIGFGVGAIITAASCVQNVGSPQLLPCKAGYILPRRTARCCGFSRRSARWRRSQVRQVGTRLRSLAIHESHRRPLTAGRARARTVDSVRPRPGFPIVSRAQVPHWPSREYT